MFNDFEKYSSFVYSCISSTFSWHNAFLWITFIWSIASFNFSGPLIIFSVKNSLMDCFINLSVLTRNITWFLSFLFSPCNNTTTVKSVLLKFNPPHEVLVSLYGYLKHGFVDKRQLFFIWVFFHEHSHESRGRGRPSLSPLYFYRELTSVRS